MDPCADRDCHGFTPIGRVEAARPFAKEVERVGHCTVGWCIERVAEGIAAELDAWLVDDDIFQPCHCAVRCLDLETCREIRLVEAPGRLNEEFFAGAAIREGIAESVPPRGVMGLEANRAPVLPVPILAAW